MHHDIDKSYDVCERRLCYFLAKEYEYKDLSWIGVLSAIGDMQNMQTGHFEGLNKIIQKDAINEGYLKLHESDINLYGRSTRPLFVALSYFSDIKLPITNNRNESMAVLEEIGIDEKNNRRTLSQLTHEEKGRLYEKLVEMLSKELPGKYVQYIPRLIIGDSYTFLKEEKGTSH